MTSDHGLEPGPDDAVSAACSRLSIACEQHERFVLVRLEGELDTYTARAFRHEVGRWDPATVQLVFDLSRVRLLDSAGLGALVSLRNEADRAGRTVALIRPTNGALARLFRLCGLHRAFAIEADLPGVRRALAAHRRPLTGVGGGRPRSGAWA